MEKRSWMGRPDSFTDNRKSKTCAELSRSIQNRKWAGLVPIGVAFVICGVVAQAQQPKKVARIGYLSSVSPPTDSYRSEAFR